MEIFYGRWGVSGGNFWLDRTKWTFFMSCQECTEVSFGWLGVSGGIFCVSGCCSWVGGGRWG